MEIIFDLKPEDELTPEQLMEIEAARDLIPIEDADCPELSPEKTPELWARALEALAERNRRMARRMA